MTIVAYHHPGFAADIGDHVMPMRKFQMVADGLGAFPNVRVDAPTPVTDADLLRVHTAEYVTAVRTGEPRALAQSQKFPWSPALYPSVLLTNGGLVAAARQALQTGAAAALASGFHHANGDHGEGFCTFNGLVVAGERLRDEGRLGTVAVLDLDLHYGNGTASLCPSRPWLFNCSIYGNDYWQNTAYKDVAVRRHEDGDNHVSYALPNGSGRAAVFDALERGTKEIFAWGRPDLVLYQAGADPYKEDPYSPLDLDAADLQARDHWVFEWAQRHQLPIAWVLAGGYTPDTQKVVDVHLGTFAAATAVFGA